MKKTVLLVQLSLIWIWAVAQKNDPSINLNKIENKIIKEGINLYQLEMAASIGWLYIRAKYGGPWLNSNAHYI